MKNNENESKLLLLEICFEIGYFATSGSDFRKNISANAASKKFSLKYPLQAFHHIFAAAMRLYQLLIHQSNT